MSINYPPIVQSFVDTINSTPNLTDAEKQEQINNYVISIGMPELASTYQGTAVQQYAAAGGNALFGSDPSYQQQVTEQQNYDAFLAPTRLPAPGELGGSQDVYNPSVNYVALLPTAGNQNVIDALGTYATSNPDVNIPGAPTVDSIQPSQNDYLDPNLSQTQYPLADFAVEQQQLVSQYPPVDQPITETEYVPQWLSPFVQWVSTYNNPNATQV